MVGGSKILTVSYGTFSCTLEGFDEPFSTMKSIAEYFRDLAADDRYFGAEPPTPDAEMLHRIAEREVQRRVEARVEENGIVLRQAESDTPAAPAAVVAPVAAAAAPEAEAAHAPEPVAEAPDAPERFEEDTAEDFVAPLATPAADDSIAAKLSRIRAVVARSRAETQSEDEYEEVLPASPDFSAPIESAFAADLPVDAEAEEVAAVEAPVDDADTEEDDGSIADAIAALTAAQAEDAAEDEDEELAAEEEAAADLEEIAESQGVAAEAIAAAEDAVVEAEAEAADDLEESEDTSETEVDHATNEDAAELDEGETEDAFFDSAEAEAETYDDDGDAAPMPQSARDDIKTRILELSDEDEAALAAAEEAEQAEMPDTDFAEEEPEADDWAAGEEVDTAAEVLEETVADASSDENATAEDGLLGAEDEDELQRELAAIEADEDAAENLFDEGFENEDSLEIDDEAFEDDDLADEDDEEQTSSILAAVSAATKTPEAAPVQETGEVETAKSDGADKDDGAEDLGRAAAFSPEDQGEAAFDRILEETNSKLDETEGTRRRSAIAHLKAAVAATKADRLLKRVKGADDPEEQSQYRDDLAKVVRPRRPTTEIRPTTKPRPTTIDEKPAPLMLVSEQRVDESSASPRSVMPRRVDLGNLAVDARQGQDPDMSFPEFIDQVGAKELPDLLEAAAAYSAFVEGHKQFSRPQLMRRVASSPVGSELYTREAGLRSFGQLLRQGKIQKLKRGQFTITEETRFNPEARMAGE